MQGALTAAEMDSGRIQADESKSEAVFTPPAFLRKMAFSHAIPCGNFAAPSGWVWHFACACVV